MRKIDEAKKQQIVQAVLQLSRDEGITNLSIGKIATSVGVSKATIYVYYENKTDMLSKIYLDVKNLMDEGLAEIVNSDLSYRNRVKAILAQFAHRFIDHPLEAMFMRSINENVTLIDEATNEKINTMIQPLFDLMTEGTTNNYLQSNDFEIVTAVLFSPIEYFVNDVIKNEIKANEVDEKLNRLIDIVTDSILTD